MPLKAPSPAAVPNDQTNLDWLIELLSNALDRLGVLEALGITKRTRGVVNVTTVAAAIGTTANVAHGLGTTPTAVLLTSQNTSGAGLTSCGATNVGATTFDANIRYGDGVARSLTIVVGWEAIA
jgi:hypothetical protein